MLAEAKSAAASDYFNDNKLILFDPYSQSRFSTTIFTYLPSSKQIYP